MQAKAFEHFAADNHNSFLKDCSITLVNITWFRTHEKRRVVEKGFENCNSLWVKYFKLLLSPFIHFSEAGV